MKKFFSILLSLAFIFNIVYTQPALAATDLSKTTYFPDGSYIVTTLSVSYTHLDVYKRQPLNIDMNYVILIQMRSEICGLTDLQSSEHFL